MDKFKQILKDNKYTVIALIIFILLVVLGFAVYKFLFPNIGSPVYGNRLNGIEKVEITKAQKEEIKEKLEEKDYVVSIDSYVKGRIYNVVIKVDEDTKEKDAKNLTKIVVENLEEKQLDYFDVQVFLSNENEEVNGYPIIGYLNKESKSFVYSQEKTE